MDDSPAVVCDGLDLSVFQVSLRLVPRALHTLMVTVVQYIGSPIQQTYVSHWWDLFRLAKVVATTAGDG